MARLDGKTALVTGGSRGIGRAIVVELAREGARVALNYQSSDAKAQAVADEVAALGGAVMLVKANVGVASEARAMVKRVAEEFGRLDVLVNNAGITRDCSLKKMTDEQWEEVIKTNLGGYFYCN
jgi:NAD(P)-dependent dehydrogenase (short-subunit alcohol dehydrogenase family)